MLLEVVYLAYEAERALVGALSGVLEYAVVDLVLGDRVEEAVAHHSTQQLVAMGRVGRFAQQREHLVLGDVPEDAGALLHLGHARVEVGDEARHRQNVIVVGYGVGVELEALAQNVRHAVDDRLAALLRLHRVLNRHVLAQHVLQLVEQYLELGHVNGRRQRTQAVPLTHQSL